MNVSVCTCTCICSDSQFIKIVHTPNYRIMTLNSGKILYTGFHSLIDASHAHKCRL